MDCPFCGKEMKEGLIPSRDRLRWRDKALVDTILLSSWSEEVKAYFCPDCRQIVLPVPEIEGVLEKMERKLSAAGDKIEAAQKQWEVRRAEKQEETKKKKLGQKDPWEL